MYSTHCRHLLLSAGLALALAATAPGQITWYVDDDNCPGTGSQEDPFCRIQDAINSAVNGDEVVVADGTYSGPGNVLLDYGGRLIAVRSADGPDDCVIDLALGGRAFRFHSGETADAVLEGFTIRNGFVTGNGGAILCEAGSNPTIRSCHFDNNQANEAAADWTGTGGAIRCDASAPAIVDCTFTDNRAASAVGFSHGLGGAIFAEFSHGLVIEGCTFTDNHATGTLGDSGLGGAIVVGDSGPVMVTGCTFTENTAAGVGAVMIWHDTVFAMRDCSFVYNRALEGSGGAVAVLSDSQGTVRGCTFVDNEADPGHSGALMVWSASPAILDCSFTGNSSVQAAGGIGVYAGSRPWIVNCAFMSNGTGTWGGAIDVYTEVEDSLPTVVNCRFTGNSATNGGAVHNQTTGIPKYVNCTFMYNSATSGGGMRNVSCSPIVANSIFWGNDASQIINQMGASPGVSYCDVQGGYLGDGNINVDPKCVDAAGHDVRLESGSPCIDAGDNTAVPLDEIDLDEDGNVLERIPLDLTGKRPRFVDDPDETGSGNPDGAHSLVDIGAFEFCRADVIIDGTVDVDDLVAVIVAWGTSDPDADTNADGTVSVDDLVSVIVNWGPCQ